MPDKPIMEMTRAEFEAAKRKLAIQANLNAKSEAGDRFMEKMKARHENTAPLQEPVPRVVAA